MFVLKTLLMIAAGLYVLLALGMYFGQRRHEEAHRLSLDPPC